ncbi:MAG TPA: alpha/beta hydrolase [Conexibacter sp.]|nr:alpha/beta hydrolase [Conexibacter sp.]
MGDDATRSAAAEWRAPQLGRMRELALSDGVLRCYEAGERGPLHVLVHGALLNANVWRHVVARLAPSCRCVALDLPLGAHVVPMPGADRTPAGLARTIAEAIEALDADEVTLVGNDTGGLLCQLVAARHPQRVGRLVLSSCEFRGNCPPAVFAPMNALARLPGGLLAYLAPGQVPPLQRLPLAYGRLAKRPFEPRAAASYTRPAVARRAIRADFAAFLRGYGRDCAEAAADGLARFERPALVAWAREDRVFPARDAHALAALLPDARLRWIDDAYALAPEDRPDRFAELLSAFADVARL